MTDTALLADYADRKDAEAFGQLVARYQRLIFATCRRVLHEPQDVDDAVQETFLRLATRAGELHSNLGAWLHRCAVTVSIDLNRRRDARRRHEAAAANSVIIGDDAQQTLAELREHLDVALEKIEPEPRELIIQRFFVGRAQTELAAEEGVSPSTMSERVDQAIASLREQLGRMKGGMLAAGGVALLGGLLESEHASAAVPAQLTANVMKIGLTGVSTGATGVGAFSIFSSLIGTLLIGLAAIVFIAAGIWILRGKATAPTSTTPATVAAPTGPPVAGITTGAVQDPAAAMMAKPPQWTATQPAGQPAVLFGRIVDQKGNPVANATVGLEGPSASSVKTDANGNYFFRTIGAAGEYHIGVQAAGFMDIGPYGSDEPPMQISSKSQARRDLVLERGATVHVRVDDLLGAPLANAEVYLVNTQDDRGRSRKQTTTGRNGVATFVVAVSKIPYNIAATIENHEPVHEIVTVDSIDPPKDVALQLLPATPIKGVAICSDGKPAFGWTVSAKPQWWDENTNPSEDPIDKDGNFTLSRVGPGLYTLEFLRKDTGRSGGTVRLPPASQPFRLDLPFPSPASVVTLDGHVRITGGQPDYVTVEANGGTFATFQSANMTFSPAKGGPHSATQPVVIDGSFTLSDLEPGTYRITFDSPQLETKILEKVKVPGELPVIELKMVGKPRLRGVVVDGGSGKPIPQFAVRAKKLQTLGNGPNYGQGDQWTQISDPSGNFDIEVVGPGIYQAQVSAEGYAWKLSDEVRIESTAPLPPVAIKLLPGGTLTGRVVDGSAAGVGGAKVIPLSTTKVNSIFGKPGFNGDAGAVITDGQGHFTITHLAAGAESIKVVSDRFAPQVMSGLQIKEGQTIDAGSLTMLVGGTVEGTVYDDRGRPSAGANLQFSDDYAFNGDEQRHAASLARVSTDSSGHFRVEHLPQQLMYVEATDWWQRHGVGRRVVRPIDGKAARLDFGGTAPVKGRLLVNGKPAANARVQLSLHPEYLGLITVMAATDAEGRFVFFGPPPGPYTFLCAVQGADDDFLRVKDITISDPPADLGDINADFGSVAVTVQADDPADLKSLSYGSIDTDAFGTLNPIQLVSLNADGDKHDRWHASNVRPGKLRATIQSQGPGNLAYSTPFERLAGAGECAIALRVPHMSAELTIRFTGGAPASPKSEQYALLRSADDRISTVVHTDTDVPLVVKLPAGTYHVMNYTTARPWPDIPPIELKDGESRQLDIPQLDAAVRRFELCVCTADGVPLPGTAIHLADGQGKSIEPADDRTFGTDFLGPPGRYRATVDRPGMKPLVMDVEVPEVSQEEDRIWLPIPTASP